MSNLKDTLLKMEKHNSIFENEVRKLDVPTCAVFGSSTSPAPAPPVDIPDTPQVVTELTPYDNSGVLSRRTPQPLADREINLTRIESRSSTGSEWRHVFFLEMDGHITDRAILTAVEELRRLVRYAKVFGSYPRPS